MSDLLGKSTTKRTKPNYWYSIVSVAMVLFLLGFFGLMVIQTQQLIDVFKERVNILVEIEPGTTETDISSLLAELKQTDYLKAGTLNHISKEAAMESLRDDFGEDFMALDLPNPLYDVLTFNVEARSMNSDLLSQIKTNFKARDYVHDVYYQEGLVQVIAENVGKIGWFAFGFSLLFLLVAVTLIHNTIRLALYSNRFLIKNMELVGASWGFISRPYIKKSIWHGVLSAIIAIAALVFVLLLAQSEIAELKIVQNTIGTILVFLILLLVGILISGLSTYYVINKYLKMRLEELY